MKPLLYVTQTADGTPSGAFESVREAATGGTSHGLIERYVLEGSVEHAQALPKESYFGTFFELMKSAVSVGGSELGLGMTLFSLVVSTRATTIIETGRYKGFSGLALASGLKLLDDPTWMDLPGFRSRPEVNYEELEKPKTRRLYSYDIAPTQESEALFKRAGLDDYIIRINGDSLKAPLPPEPQIDIAFIDGDHGYDACEADINRFNYIVKPGGLLIIHDYFGWYDHHGHNKSPIKQVADKITQNRFKQHLLIDTGYPSLMILRKPNPVVD